jgi:uncharacterized protein (DUF1501 family)
MWTRRALIKSGGLTLLTLGVGPGLGPSFLRRTALAAPGPRPLERRRVLVALFQRGAMDGLMAVAPVSDPHLARMRPRLAMSAARSAGEGVLLDLGVGFGLHPAFEPLLPLWRDGRLAVVHAVGSPDPTRSHFDAQDYMETGTPGRKGTDSGWLNRVSGLLGHEATPFRSVSMTASLPRSLAGQEPALAVEDLGSFRVRLRGAPKLTAAAGQGFEALYEQASEDLLRQTGSETFDAVERLSQAHLERDRPAPGAQYPRSPLGRSLRQVAMLIKADLGLEVAFVESGGWDTHVAQGTDRGSFARRADDLARSVAAFWTDLEAHQDEVLLLTMTEFGRTVRENGSGGTDHGHGSCLFVLGNRVDGGKVHGSFPYLSPDALFEGRDLPVTTDFRSVFAAAAGGHLRLSDDAAVFPGWTGRRLALLKS